MRAVVLTSEGVRFDPDYPDPRPAEGEIPVRVLRAGICETDLQLIQGYMGFQGVLGHEFVGIAQAGPQAGERVVASINCSCRRCDVCRAGLPGHCPNRTVLGILNHDGAFADVVSVPTVNVHRVPDDVATNAAVFTEPVAAALQITEQVPVDKSHKVIVLGDGRLGNLCAQVVNRVAGSVTVVGKHETKLARLDRMGIETVLLPDLSRRRQADVVIDCSGSEAGLPLALELVKTRGIVVMKTTRAGAHRLSLASLVVDEVTLVGSRCGPFAKALIALKDGHVTVEPLVDATYRLSDAVDALERADRSDVLKVLLDVECG